MPSGDSGAECAITAGYMIVDEDGMMPLVSAPLKSLFNDLAHEPLITHGPGKCTAALQKVLEDNGRPVPIAAIRASGLDSVLVKKSRIISIVKSVTKATVDKSIPSDVAVAKAVAESTDEQLVEALTAMDGVVGKSGSLQAAIQKTQELYSRIEDDEGDDSEEALNGVKRALAALGVLRTIPKETARSLLPLVKRKSTESDGESPAEEEEEDFGDFGDID
jgi:formaldehyde-activating enzyme involved in methanogenesis